MVDQKGIGTPGTGRAARWCAAVGLAALVAVAGCSGLRPRRTNAVEVQLRQQRIENDELRRELEATRTALSETRRRMAALSETPAGSADGVTFVSASADSVHPVQRLEVNALLSGGLDRDSHPGDELLSVLVTTVDLSGAPVRAEGSLSVTAFDYALPTDEQQVGHWEWDVDATAALWRDGLVGTGFRFTEPWQRSPRSRDIVLHARFISSDGRQFDVTRTVTIDVPRTVTENDGPVTERSAPAAGDSGSL